MVLIITNKQDIHPTPVIKKFLTAGVSYFRLNTECLLSDYDISYRLNDSYADFVIKDRLSGKICEGSSITSVWDRRPQAPSELRFDNGDEINVHNLQEATEFLMYIRYALMQIPSLGSILNDRPASSKILQYQVAKKAGLQIPDTLFTNSKNDVEDFAINHKYLAIKEMSGKGVLDAQNNSEYILWSQKLSSQQVLLADNDSFSQCVSFIQDYIDKAYELRVTFVGDEVFTCIIDSQKSDNGKIDWRLAQSDTSLLRASDIPNELKNKCKSFLHQLGLTFGCFDFIVTPKGEYVFLECNPNGQWLWIEMATGLRISESIYMYLTQWEN